METKRICLETVTNQDQSILSVIPKDVYKCTIAEYLDAKTLAAFSQTCKMFYSIFKGHLKEYKKAMEKLESILIAKILIGLLDFEWSEGRWEPRLEDNEGKLYFWYLDDPLDRSRNPSIFTDHWIYDYVFLNPEDIEKDNKDYIGWLVIRTPGKIPKNLKPIRGAWNKKTNQVAIFYDTNAKCILDILWSQTFTCFLNVPKLIVDVEDVKNEVIKKLSKNGKMLYKDWVNFLKSPLDGETIQNISGKFGDREEYDTLFGYYNNLKRTDFLTIQRLLEENTPIPLESIKITLGIYE